MMRLMRPVADFLNKLKEERANWDDEDLEKGPLQELIEKSVTEDVNKIASRDVFISPPITTLRMQVGPEMQRIQYNIPIDKVKSVKKALKVRSFK